MREDDIEIKGSALDKMLLMMEEKGRTGILIQGVTDEWKLIGMRPSVGTGKYVEVMPDGEVREYTNTSEDEMSYQRIRQLNLRRRTA